ncbi:unnamed protein product, partial [Musa acuminata subsp. burmannicoides]
HRNPPEYVADHGIRSPEDPQRPRKSLRRCRQYRPVDADGRHCLSAPNHPSRRCATGVVECGLPPGQRAAVDGAPRPAHGRHARHDLLRPLLRFHVASRGARSRPRKMIALNKNDLTL